MSDLVNNQAELLNQLFDDAALIAMKPMLVLSVGMLLLLMAGVFETLKSAKSWIVLGSLLLAFLGEVRIFTADSAGLMPDTVFGGTYAANQTSALWGMLFLASATLAWLFSRKYYVADKPFETEHDALLLTTPIGMLLMAGSQHLITFFVGLELLSIPLYALAAFRRNRTRSVEAGLKYFLLGAFAAGFLLYGTALLYAGTGTLQLGELIAIFSASNEGAGGAPNSLSGVGVGLIAAALFFKISVFPFQLWVPDVYQGSPTPVSALMATGTKAAAFAFLLNFSPLLPTSAALTIAFIALITMAVGNLGALVQTDAKRMLAYSGIAHAGTLLLAVAAVLKSNGALLAEAQNAALFYMGAYLFTAAGAFGLLGLLESRGEETTLESLRGLSSRHPAIAAALALFMLSLGGIPATGGFLGKWFVFATAVQADMIVITVVGVLLSVIALGYYLRILVAMYMQSEEPQGGPRSAEKRLATTIAASACVLAVLLMGILPNLVLNYLS